MFRWPYYFRKKEGKSVPVPHLGGLMYKFDCIFENLYIQHESLPADGVYKAGDREKKVLVSMTTFPERIGVCYYAIKSLMLQSFQADRIILWLAEEQFPNHQLPEKYEELTKRGLEIRFCDDLKSHKKYFYALQEQKKDEVVITFDDDIIFERDAILKLMEAHKRYPDCIICNRGQHIAVEKDGISAYSEWTMHVKDGHQRPIMRIVPSTGAGCLYPYGIMPKTTFDKALMYQTAPRADDLWMRFNSLSAGVEVVKTREWNATLCTVNNSQEHALTKHNDLSNGNQEALDRLCKTFPDAVTLCCNSKY